MPRSPVVVDVSSYYGWAKVKGLGTYVHTVHHAKKKEKEVRRFSRAKQGSDVLD